MKGLAQVLLGIQRGCPGRSEAASRLHAELTRMMETVGPSNRIPEQDWPDMVNDVMVHLLSRVAPPPPAVDNDDARCEAYLRTSLRNLFRSRLRSDRRREKALESERVQTEPQKADEPFVTGAFDLQHAWALLEKAYLHALSEREERFKPSLASAWVQLHRLTLERVTMDQLLREEEGPRKQAQQRIHANQSRLRKTLTLATGRLARSGALSAEEACIVLNFIEELKKRQKKAPTGISKGETT